MSDIAPWQNPKTNPNPASRAAAPVLESIRKLQRHDGSVAAWLRIWWPALAWAVVIFVMSTDQFSAEHTRWFLEPVIRWFAPGLTHKQIELVHRVIRKCAHFTEYFVFATLLYRGIRGARTGWRWTWGLAALAIAAGYSALDEIHQAFVASREARVTDSLLDSTGAFFAIAVLWIWFRSRRPGTTSN